MALSILDVFADACENPMRKRPWNPTLRRTKGGAPGIKIDKLTPEQEEYLAGWSEGT
jgi:hypothetical protein